MSDQAITDSIADKVPRPTRFPETWNGPRPVLPWQTPEEREIRRLKRNQTRNFFAASVVDTSGPAGRAAMVWLLPWQWQRYPGRSRGIAQALGVSIDTVENYRCRGVCGVGHIEKLAAIVRARAELGLRVAALLEADVAARKARRKPRGLQIIGEDGLRKHQARRGRAKRRVAGPPSSGK